MLVVVVVKDLGSFRLGSIIGEYKKAITQDRQSSQKHLTK